MPIKLENLSVGAELHYAPWSLKNRKTMISCIVLAVYGGGRPRARIKFFNESGEERIKIVSVNNLRRRSMAKIHEDAEEIILEDERCDRRCNLCNHPFRARNRFMRFCDTCKSRNEIYKFAGCV